MFTVWEFRSVRGEVVRVIRRSEPMEATFQHEYQRILYRGNSLDEAKKFAA